jgi:hypothetical protein
MSQMITRLVFYGLLITVMGTVWAQEPRYDGLKKCKSCHKSQYDSWLETGHGQAMKSLEAGEKTEAKEKAGLDPDEDYTEDPDRVGCHVTGYEKEGGYSMDNPERLNKFLIGVGCESCHGPGSLYKKLHRTAGEKFDESQEATPRKELADLGQALADEEFEERCNACHLNYEGSPWPHAEEPYTPFTPEVDPKYEFKFKEAMRDDKAMHKHYKLEGVFSGSPVVSFREEFQKDAEPPEE